MNLKEVKKEQTNVVELTIEVKGDDFKAAVDNAFKKNIKKMNVPGFRKGKAPRKMVERLYGEGVFYDDAINALYPKAYDDAVKESGIKPVDKPNIDVKSVDSDGFEFTVTVTVKPEVTLGEYKGIKVQKPVYNVKEADVKAEIEKLQKQNQRIVDVDREAADKDSVNIDFDGSVDGVPFDGGKAEGHDLVLGSGAFIPGFEEQLIGKKKGDEFEVNVTFPEDYHAEELKGKAAVFKTNVNAVKEIQLPELDDEFAKDVSEFETLAQLKADIKKKLKADKEKQAETELDNALVEKVVELTTVEIPPVMIENMVNNMIGEFEQRLTGSGLNINSYLSYTGMDMEAFKKSYEAEAEKRVKTRLALEKIVELEGIVVDDKEVEAEYQSIADNYKMPVEQVKMYLPFDDIVLDMAVGKAVELVKNAADVTVAPPKKVTAKKAAPKKTDADEQKKSE